MSASELIHKGKSQGFLFADDILAEFPNLEDDIPAVNEFWSSLLDNEIDVVDQAPEKRQRITLREHVARTRSRAIVSNGHSSRRQDTTIDTVLIQREHDTEPAIGGAADSVRLFNISPLFHASKVKNPVMVLQGANDPRVLQVESDEIVEAIKKNNVPIEYVIFPDEGHGFIKKENEIKGYGGILTFLDKYLKGETEVAN